MGVGNPGKHFPTLFQHLFGRGGKIGIDLYGYGPLRDQAGDLPDHLSVKGEDFIRAELAPLFQSPSGLGIFGDEGGVGGLAVEESQ